MLHSIARTVLVLRRPKKSVGLFSSFTLAAIAMTGIAPVQFPELALQLAGETHLHLMPRFWHDKMILSSPLAPHVRVNSAGSQSLASTAGVGDVSSASSETRCSRRTTRRGRSLVAHLPPR